MAGNLGCSVEGCKGDVSVQLTDAGGALVSQYCEGHKPVRSRQIATPQPKEPAPSEPAVTADATRR